jgi:aryl-phospho-beta-D-glucosidase BglC (GH1 family)
MKRRKFLKAAGTTASALGLFGAQAPAFGAMKTSDSALPKWKGFNLLDYFTSRPPKSDDRFVKDDHLKWMRDWGFDFVRFPMSYPRFLNIDYSRDITPDEVYNIDKKEVDKVLEIVQRANKFGLHVSLNLHRAPGYCVNSGFHEPFNLWKDKEAQDAFIFHWEMWAKLFKDYTPKQVSFDLVNEPGSREDMNDQHSKRGPVPGDVYRKVAKRALDAIRKYNPEHLVIADGNNTGSDVIPEITDLDIGQSCRGYYPHYISHYKAPWAVKDPSKSPEPKWPGEMGGKYFSREDLEKFYAPWIDLVKQGVGVHCGECGCWKKTPHKVFLAWFEDVLSILSSHNIGFGIWNFIGDFGILDSGREDVKYDDWHGHKLDTELLKLLQKY